MKIFGLDLNKILDLIAKYKYFLVISVTVLLFMFALYRINTLSSVERNETLYEEKVLSIDKIEFKEEAIQRIIDLNDLNVEIQSDFEAGRNNPFQN